MYAKDRIINYARSYFPVYTIAIFKTRFKASEMFRRQHVFSRPCRFTKKSHSASSQIDWQTIRNHLMVQDKYNRPGKTLPKHKKKQTNLFVANNSAFFSAFFS